MSTTIPAVPAVIPRARYVQMFKDLGFTPEQISTLECKADGVYVTVFALREDGTRVVLSDPGEGYAKHRIFIPVDDGVPAEVDKRAYAAAEAHGHMTPTEWSREGTVPPFHYRVTPIDVTEEAAA